LCGGDGGYITVIKFLESFLSGISVNLISVFTVPNWLDEKKYEVKTVYDIMKRY